MPRGDRTGPTGNGPMTGLKMGFCAGQDGQEFARGGFGCGMGRGRARSFGGGRGMAFRHGGWGVPASAYPLTPQVNEADQLKVQIDNLEKTLSALKQRLEKANEAGEE